jgi:molybdopterin molybdotransferase
VDYVRVCIHDERVEPLTPTKGSGAAILSSTTLADGFVLVPQEATGLAGGQPVEVFLYDS